MNNELTEKVDKLTLAAGTTADKVIPILQAIQNEFNYLLE